MTPFAQTSVPTTTTPHHTERGSATTAHNARLPTAWGRISSLIETAKMNGVEPFAYLKATLMAIVAGHPAAKIDGLLPWALTADSH